MILDKRSGSKIIMDKLAELLAFLDDAKIPQGTYNIHTEDSTPVIYKYVSSERITTCLPNVGDGTLRATQPSALNDPFECAIFKVFEEQSQKEGNIELARILTEINPSSAVGEKDVAEARVRYGSLFMRELFSRQLSTRFGIVSLATDPRHPLMWSHYTVDGSGFAIGYDLSMLFKLSSREGCLRPVMYRDKPSMVLGYGTVGDEGNVNIFLSQKGSHWSYEREWRLIVNLNETVGTGHTDRHEQPINLLRIPNEAVVRVYHTERTPPGVVDEVAMRLGDPNNRYRAQHPTKLVLSEDVYGYEDAAS